MSDKFYVGLDLTSFENNGLYQPISRVTLMADNDNAYTAGDDTGMELLASCAHATQAMVNGILASVGGHRYQAYSAGSAGVDPAAELGDGVDVGGVYSVLSRFQEDGYGYSGISAPGELELEEEYPSAGPMTQEFDRKLATTRSLISKTAEEILLQVEATDGRLGSLSVRVDGINATVQGLGGDLSTIDQKVNSIALRVQGVEGDVSAIEQKVDSITLSVNNGSTSSSISLKAGGVEIASGTISMSGLVTFTGLSSGTTTIDGACIRTGIIDANRLNLSGAITFGDLSSSVQDDINDAWSMANSAQNIASDVDNTVGRWTYSGSTYIDGNMLMTNTVRASSLEGGSVSLLNSLERTVGVMTMTGSSSSSYAVELASYGALRLTADSGDVFLQSGHGSFIQLKYGIISFGGDIGPGATGVPSCGTSSNKWSSVYAVSGTIQTSDRTKKHEISYDLAKYDRLFDLLAPASYKMDEGTSGRTHLGMISQDIEASLAACGLTSQDFGGFIKAAQYDEQGYITGYEYAIRYDEFTALCIRRIQALEGRITQLEERYGTA